MSICHLNVKQRDTWFHNPACRTDITMSQTHADTASTEHVAASGGRQTLSTKKALVANNTDFFLVTCRRRG